MQIEILGTESLGVRGLSCLVEVKDRKIVIDPGLALGYNRHGLLPHPLQVSVGESVRQKILTVLEDFGTDTERYVSRHPWANRLARGADIGGKRMKEDERLAVYCYPLRGWNDAVFHNLLMARAAACQIRDLVHISYQPAAEAFRNILPIIEAHIDIADAGGAICLTEEGPEAAQASIDYWWPRVGLCFGGRETEREKKLMKLGLKHTGNQALRQLWDEDCEQALTKLGLQRPE